MANLHIQKHPVRNVLVAGFLTIILFFAAYPRPKSPASHGIAFEFEQKSDVAEKSSLDDVFNSTLGFEKLLVLNLPHRTDHRDRFILQCAISQIEIEFVDGVNGDTVPEKVLPADYWDELSAKEIGSWRAHINAVERVVHENLDSALIMEDDVDWDIRIKSLLKDFAISAQAIVANPSDSELYFNDLPKANPPTNSPYGDDWDLLWLGHCRSSLPDKIIIQLDDESVPEPHYLRSWLFGEITPLSIFPNHTRAVTQSPVLTCSLAYAVSQRGARKLLYDIGIQQLSAPFDVMLARWCMGNNGTCVSVLPQLFDHHRVRGPVSLESDINDKTGFRYQAVTNNVRLSVAMNMQKLVDGSNDYDDQYPDTV